MAHLVKTLAGALFVVSVLFFTNVSADKEKDIMEDVRKADAFIDCEATQVTIGLGISWGSCELKYEGVRYPLHFRGLKAVGVGVTTAKLTGNVYDLKNIKDIEGNYTAGGVSATVGGGAGAVVLKNENQVVLEVWSTTKGLDFSIGGAGVTLKFDE